MTVQASLATVAARGDRIFNGAIDTFEKVVQTTKDPGAIALAAAEMSKGTATALALYNGLNSAAKDQAQATAGAGR
nr:hypothetical protein [uncultured Limnobacter sp.]